MGWVMPRLLNHNPLTKSHRDITATTVWFWPVEYVINKTFIVIFQTLPNHPKDLCPFNAAAASNLSSRGQGHSPQCGP
jgi:hypothetical protein